uniref:Uncharacterized protein n=1 Tax=Ananas comosus var. bracteatus TaxID=296719 RepID=A0A6V7Q993_ANACO|nr:unnamed protein product [Ananas comosus var. bracteatus]
MNRMYRRSQNFDQEMSRMANTAQELVGLKSQTLPSIEVERGKYRKMGFSLQRSDAQRADRLQDAKLQELLLGKAADDLCGGGGGERGDIEEWGGEGRGGRDPPCLRPARDARVVVRKRGRGLLALPSSHEGCTGKDTAIVLPALLSYTPRLASAPTTCEGAVEGGDREERDDAGEEGSAAASATS